MKRAESSRKVWRSSYNMVGKKRSRSTRKYGKASKKTKIIKAISSKQMLSRPLSNVMPVSLHYNTRVTINPGVLGAVGQNVFRLGSIFDPDFTGVGHQPVGHDQLDPLFERYQVWKIDFKICFANRDNTNNQRIGYRVSDTSAIDSNPDVNVENGNCEWTLLGIAGSGPREFKGSIYPYEVHGQTYKQYMANDDYGAQFGSNPLEDAYFIVWGDGLGADTSPIDVGVHLVYHTKLMGNKLTALS